MNGLQDAGYQLSGIGCARNEKAYESPLSRAKRHHNEVPRILADLISYKDELVKRLESTNVELSETVALIRTLENG